MGILEFLKANDIKDLFICSMVTHMCVDAMETVAKDFGFNCTIISDACAIKGLEIQGKSIIESNVQTVFLAALHYFYARIQTVAEYLRDWIKIILVYCDSINR